MDIEIKSNVPVPESRGRKPKYPWPKMAEELDAQGEGNVGVIFEVDSEEFSNIRSSAWHWANRNRPDIRVRGIVRGRADGGSGMQIIFEYQEA